MFQLACFVLKCDTSFSVVDVYIVTLSSLLQMICSHKAEFSCDYLCGNPLPCGNHYCTKTCHALKIGSSSLGRHERGESCEYCDLPCQKVRGYMALNCSFSNVVFNVLVLTHCGKYFFCSLQEIFFCCNSFSFDILELSYYSGETTNMSTSLPPALSSW